MNESPPLLSTLLFILGVVFFVGFLGNVGSNGAAALVGLALSVVCIGVGLAIRKAWADQ